MAGGSQEAPWLVSKWGKCIQRYPNEANEATKEEPSGCFACGSAHIPNRRISSSLCTGLRSSAARVWSRGTKTQRSWRGRGQAGVKTSAKTGVEAELQTQGEWQHQAGKQSSHGHSKCISLGAGEAGMGYQAEE